jgi:hypothetical protein
MGVTDGDRLLIVAEPDGSYRLTSVSEVIDKFRGILRDFAPGRDLTAELIAERREEARREGKE